jgi:hypothetical protein
MSIRYYVAGTYQIVATYVDHCVLWRADTPAACAGEERQVNVSEAVTVTLPILSFPALVFSTAGEEVDLRYYIPRCQVWDPTAQAFSAAFCTVKSFTATLIQCAVRPTQCSLRPLCSPPLTMLRACVVLCVVANYSAHSLASLARRWR